MKNKLLRLIVMLSKLVFYGIALQVFFFSMLLANSGTAQEIKSIREAKLEIKMNNASIKDVFQFIEQKTNYKFFYDDEVIDKNVRLSINRRSILVSDILLEISKTSKLKFKQINKVINVNRHDSNYSDDKNVIEVIIQARTVTGTVNDQTGSPLPGVNIVIQGTSTGTISDASGNYTLEVTNENAVLMFSYIGYTTETVQLQGRSVVNVSLKEDLQALEEVVVVGYGTTSKRELTGAVTTIKSKELTSLKSSTVDAMLQGQGTGIQVSQAAGIPGGPIRVMVRGTSSISAGTEPLWVIDGLPMKDDLTIGGASRGTVPQNPLASLNPNDIESIEVLKDAAATAIFGSRGANGVILVTTKSGKSGTGSITFDVTYGVSDLTKSPEDMGYATTEQFMQIMEIARTNSGITTPFTDEINSMPRIAGRGSDRITDFENLENNFGFDDILRKGGFQEYNLSSSIGFDKGNIYISGNYRSDKGVLKNNDFDRVSFRVNTEYNPLKNLSTGVRFNLSYTNNRRALDGGEPSGNDQVASGGFNEAATGALPFIPRYNAQGEYFNPVSGMNLVATTDKDYFNDEFVTYRGIGGAFLEYKIPFIEGLSVRSELSGDVLSSNRLFWAHQDLRPTAINYSENATSLVQNINYNYFLKYSGKIGEKHKFNVVAGSESQRTFTRNANLFGEGIPGLNQDFGAPTVISRGPSAGLGGERYIRSYFGRLSYSYNLKYLVEASFRRDGTNIFLKEYRQSFFPAVSFGWVFSEENFMDSFDFLNFGKLRFSYGKTGNQNIPDVTVERMTDWPRYGSADQAKVISGLAVTDLVWETTNAYDVALDLGFFNDRVSISAGYYRQDVIDMLFQVPLAPSVGLFEGSNMWQNVADMRNEGFEFSLNTINIERGGFRWNTNINLTTNKNKILSIIPELDESGNGINTGVTRNIAGKPLSTYYMSEYAGIDPNTGIPMIYEIDRVLFAETGETVKTGNVIPASRDNRQNHRMLLDKTGLPTFFGGITNTISYKNFELSGLLTFQGGNYIYNKAEISALSPGLGRNNLYAVLLTDSWSPENPNARYPLLSWNDRYFIDNNGNPVFNSDGTRNFNQRYDEWGSDGRASTRFLYKGDFMRLRTVQLAYNLSPELLSKMGIKGLRAYINGNNLLTFTKFPGWDPEQLNYDGNVQNRNLNQGLVSNRLPQLKSYAVGLSLTF